MTEEMVVQGLREIEANIKAALTKRGMTQRELADELNINPVILNRAIKGSSTPQSVQIRQQLKKLLDY